MRTPLFRKNNKTGFKCKKLCIPTTGNTLGGEGTDN